MAEGIGILPDKSTFGELNEEIAKRPTGTQADSALTKMDSLVAGVNARPTSDQAAAIADTLSADAASRKEQTERVIAALEKAASALGGIEDNQEESESVYEYGVAFVEGQSSPEGKRAVRIDGVLTIYDTCPSEYLYTPNHGTINYNPFDSRKEGKSMFAPVRWLDRMGNHFMRWTRFYFGKEHLSYNGTSYEIWWVCEKAPYAFYRVPKAFRRKDGTEWTNVDIACYEGGDEVIGTDTYLVSKPDLMASHSKTRGTFYENAKRCGTYLGVDTAKEWYGITELSEYTEIIQPLFVVMALTKNSQSIYGGVADTASTAVLAWDLSNGYVYVADNSTTEAEWHEHSELALSNSSDHWQEIGDEYWRRVMAAAKATGTITDGAFTEDSSGTTYWRLTLEDLSSVSVTWTAGGVYLIERPESTGGCDSIDATSGNAVHDGLHPFKVFGLENLWGNQWEFVLNVSKVGRVPYLCDIEDFDYSKSADPANNPEYEPISYSVVAGTGFVWTGLGADAAHTDAILPSVAGSSSDSTYYCDHYYESEGGNNCVVGGNVGYASNVGLFYWNLSDAFSSSCWPYGARLSHRCL